jgi:tetratricopeptide (TPR) repeat protein
MNPTRSLYCAILLLITQFSWADPRTDFDQAYKDYGLHITANNIADALDAAKNAHRLGTKVFGKKSVNVANLASNYAELLNSTEDYKKARKVLKGQVAILETRYGDTATELVKPLIESGRAWIGTKDAQEGLDYFERAAKLSNGYTNKLLEAQKNLDIVTILLRRGQGASIKPFVDKAYNIYTVEVAPNDFRLGLMSYHKSIIAARENISNEAIEYLRGALTAFKVPAGESIGDLERTVRTRLIAAYENTSQRDAATEHCLVLAANQEFSPTAPSIFRKEAVFSDAVMEQKLSGSVQLTFTIDEQGYAVDPTILASDDQQLNEPALTMIKGSRYLPRFVDGQPVATSGIEFNANFVPPSEVTAQQRSRFQRPGVRGLMNADRNDLSECSDQNSTLPQCQTGIGGK